MEIDNNKFMTLVMEKTNKKLNELQAQTIVLESQLQLAIQIVEELQLKLEKVKKPNGQCMYNEHELVFNLPDTDQAFNYSFDPIVYF